MADEREKLTAVVPLADAHQGPENRHAQIARRAFELYEHRGQEHGADLDDWLSAERELGLAPDVTTT